MATTSTASLAVSGAPVRALHAGVNSVYVTYSKAPTLTASDVIKLCRLPNRAKILGGKFGVVPGGGLLDLKLGILRPISSTASGSLQDNLLLASTTGSVTAMYDISAFAALGYQVSASDDTNLKWVEVRAECAAGGTHSLTTVIKLKIDYVVED